MKKRNILLFGIIPIVAGLTAGIATLIVNPNVGRNIGEIIYSKGQDTEGFSYAVAKAAPSVVNIYVQRLNNNYSSVTADAAEIMTSASGVIMTENGYIVTNYHVIPSVIEPNTSIWAQQHNGKIHQAFVVGYDRRTDIAVLKVNASDLPPIPINLKEPPQVGDIALTIGNPNNLGQTVTHGIVSATARTGSGLLTRDQMNIREGLQDLIQTDAPINQGNSGGALVNSKGYLIGINTASFNNYQYGVYGIGFAVPTKLVVYVLDEIIKHGRVIRGYLGISDDGTQPLSEQFSVGIRIGYIDPLGPAATSDLKVGDIIIEADGKKIGNLRSLIDSISSTRPGTVMTFKVLRKNDKGEEKIKTVDITLTEDKANID